MISFELVPRDLNSIQKQIEFIESKQNFSSLFQIKGKGLEPLPFFDSINVPDLIRFENRSWDVVVPSSYNFIPHIRVIDFDLKKDTLIKLIKERNLKHVLLITGEKSSSYNRKVYNSSIFHAIELLKKEFPNLLISVALDQYRDSFKSELTYLQDKFEAGADYVFSQPFFDSSLIETYLGYIDKSKFFIGISPVVSEKSRLYWENVNNILFPKDFICSYDWNIDFTKKVFSLDFEHLYFMPIGVDLEKYFKYL